MKDKILTGKIFLTVGIGLAIKVQKTEEASSLHLDTSNLLIPFTAVSSLLLMGWLALDLNVIQRIKCGI